jgi:DNA mismatch repair ATPase MutS
VDHLAQHIKCRSLFATHYHSLVEEWGNSPDKKHLVALGHMACVVHSNEFGADEGGGDNDDMKDDENHESHPPITFLYTLTEGSSPKSFGINVARLACLPREVLLLASQKSHQFEASFLNNKSKEELEEFGEMVKLAQTLIAVVKDYSNEKKDVELTSQEILSIWQQTQKYTGSLSSHF